MDDGSLAIRAKGVQGRTKDGSGRADICVEAMSPETRVRLVEHLAKTWGIAGRLHDRGGKAVISFPRAATDRLQEVIAPFIHPSMEYKLLPKYRGRFTVERPEPSRAEQVLVAVPILDIYEKPRSKKTHRFDLEVAGSHNYLADGVVVHNSPETTPGGRALKFYSSMRLEVRRIETIKEGTESIGNRTRVKVVKNKMAPPFRQAEFDIIFGEGISREGSLLDVAVDEGVAKKSGAWFTFEGDQLGQGRENAKRFLRENPEIAVQLQDKVFEAVGLTANVVAASDEVVPIEE
jgi:recombination protein RecA